MPALLKGRTIVGDGVKSATKKLAGGDSIFCDPPYSDAQYSRFYHVLEGIARGGWDQVLGAGRAPIGSDRPSSDLRGTLPREGLDAPPEPPTHRAVARIHFVCRLRDASDCAVGDPVLRGATHRHESEAARLRA
ncbi:DNA adenine methylase [Salinibacterium sp. CAN_S4]|uniref:DNA adenine methylase n=1 Tax=Salinibacterium sp. CAN_S4 TaxID=2787727 RepID=UPI003FA6844D